MPKFGRVEPHDTGKRYLKRGEAMATAEAARQKRFRDVIIAGADPYVGQREMARIRGISVRTLARHVNELLLIPKPEKIGVRKNGWRLSLANKSPAELERIAKQQAGPEAVARLEAAEAARRKGKDSGSQGGAARPAI